MSQVALIFGGPSGEHEVSLVSAKNIYEAIASTQLKTNLLGVSKDGGWYLVKPDDLSSTSFETPLNISEKGMPIELVKTDEGIFIQAQASDTEKIGPIDAAFPIIHGPYGEDGVLQGELNTLGLSFVGSDMLACENCLDKVKTREIIAGTAVKQAEFLAFQDSNPEYEDVKEKLGLPFFVKPARIGSSVGITKVSKKEDFLKALADARIHDNKIIIEKMVKGREVECAVLETEDGPQVTQALCEIVSHHDFYSYEAKYIDPNGADLIIPADVPAESIEAIRKAAALCFEKLECRDYCRADFFLGDDGEVYFNEINTHPGFTSISQFPNLWIQEGVQYKDLILQLFKRAMDRAQAAKG